MITFLICFIVANYMTSYVLAIDLTISEKEEEIVDFDFIKKLWIATLCLGWILGLIYLIALIYTIIISKD